uniref:TFIIS N-terminal domain-containing protein n=1 Tax=Globisporangium ultimum (strain ATCC 200006 / CBS 805.95 / DAOM BR144) TaxID=431595 RepID=K3X5J6_GLOUD
MEKFVLRGQEAAALRAQQQSLLSGNDRQRLRQTTIADGAKVVVEEVVQYLKDELDDAKTTTNMMSVLNALEKHYISLEMLEKTRIGVSLSRLQRRTESEEVRTRATLLLRTWKVRAKKAMRRRAKRVETYGRNFAD